MAMTRKDWVGWKFTYGMSRKHNYKGRDNRYDGEFPSSDDINAAEDVSYSKVNSTMYLGIPGQQTYDFKAKRHRLALDVFNEKNPDSRPVPAGLLAELRVEAGKRRDSSAKQASNKKFINHITGGVKLDDGMNLLKFIDGATEGGGDIKIYGDIMANWNCLIMARGSRPKEFVLGLEISGGGSNNPVCLARVMGILLRQSQLTLWPSNIARVNQYSLEKIPRGVLEWCHQRMMVAQVKMPTATKATQDSYRHIHNEAWDVFKRATVRWGHELDSEMCMDIKDLHDIYGNIKEMKERNIAFRMEYELTK